MTLLSAYFLNKCYDSLYTDISTIMFILFFTVNGQKAVPVVTTNSGNRQADMLYGLTGNDPQFQTHYCLSRVCYLLIIMLWHYYPAAHMHSKVMCLVTSVCV